MLANHYLFYIYDITITLDNTLVSIRGVSYTVILIQIPRTYNRYDIFTLTSLIYTKLIVIFSKQHVFKKKIVQQLYLSRTVTSQRDIENAFTLGV